jgi:hypothetical protein
MWTPFLTQYFPENLAAPEMDPRPLYLKTGTVNWIKYNLFKYILIYFANFCYGLYFHLLLDVCANYLIIIYNCYVIL